MYPDIAMMMDISTDLIQRGMNDLGLQVAGLAGKLDKTLASMRQETIRECIAACSDYANDFREVQHSSLYSAGRFDQSRACVNRIRGLLLEVGK